MKTGFAEKDITPAPGVQRAGNYFRIFIEKMHDPLKVRASVFDNGKNTVMLIGVDIGFVVRATVSKARALICRDCPGVKPENIMIAASHTHSGGSLWGFRPEELAGVSEPLRKLALEFSPSVDQEYEKFLIDGIHKAASEAFSKRSETLLSVGRGYEAGAVYNRRFLMRNNCSSTHPGKGNPDIVKPAGPVDPDVNVIGAWSEDGVKLRGCIVNYACHGTAYSQVNASADWICAMEKTIRASFGEDVVVVFLNGACGDITQVDNIGLRKNYTPEEGLDIVGTRVGAEAVKVLISSEKGNISELNMLSEEISLRRRIKDRKKTDEALKTVNDFLKNPSQKLTNDFIFAKERVLAAHLSETMPLRKTELQAVQIGPAVLLSMPAEYFCSLGLKIKKACIKDFAFVFVVELANDSIGYIPDRAAFGRKGGGYETRLTSYSNLEISAGSRIADTLILMAKKFQPVSAISGPQIDKPGTPWAYGNCPPELD